MEKKLGLTKRRRKKRVLIFGGTGFIGSYTTRRFLHSNYDVTVASIDTDVKGNEYVKGAKFIYLDLYKSTDGYMRKIMKDMDCVVFLAGADDRCVPKAPALEFFRVANVESTKRVVRIAKEIGVRKVVVASSYFTYFARRYPEWNLENIHPYIKARCEQEDCALSESNKSFAVVILQLPYVIGAINGKAPLLKALVNYVKSPFPTLFMHGGTSVIAVDHVAESILNCFEKEIGSGIYALGSKNLTWDEFVWKIHPTKKIIHIPLFCLRILGCFVDFVNLLKGMESGLRMREFARLQVKELFLDVKSCSEFFEYSDEVLDSAFEKMINES